MLQLTPSQGFPSARHPAYLSVDQGVVEEDEPVHRKPARMLQGEGPVAALTQQSALWLPQGILQANHQNHSSV